MSFGLGFLEGLSKTATKGIQDSMDDFDRRISRLSEKRLVKAEAEQTRYNKDLKDNEQEIKYLANLLNQNGGTRGMEVLQGLIQKEGGLTGAKNVIPSIVSKLTNNGMTAVNYLTTQGSTFANVDDENRVIPTYKMLARDITIPMNIPDLDAGTALQGSGMNILNLFSKGQDNAMKYAQKRVSSDMALAGYSPDAFKDKIAETPASPKVNYSLFDLQLGADIKKNLVLINSRLDHLDPKNNKDEYEKLTLLRREGEITVQNLEDKPLSINQAKTNTAFLTQKLASYFGVKSRIINAGAYSVWQNEGDKTANSVLAQNTALRFGDLITEATKVENREGGKARGATMRFYIPDNSNNKKNIKKGVFNKWNEPLHYDYGFKLAATNGLNVRMVTAEMIKNGDALHTIKDATSPYFVMGKPISYSKTDGGGGTPKLDLNKNPINNDAKKTNTIDSNANVEVLNKKINDQLVAFRTDKNAVNARAYINGIFKRNQISDSSITTDSIDVDMYKAYFKQATNMDWDDDKFGTIKGALN